MLVFHALTVKQKKRSLSNVYIRFYQKTSNTTYLIVNIIPSQSKAWLSFLPTPHKVSAIITDIVFFKHIPNYTSPDLSLGAGLTRLHPSRLTMAVTSSHPLLGVLPFELLQVWEVFQTTSDVLEFNISPTNFLHHIKQKIAHENCYDKLKSEWAMSSPECKKTPCNLSSFPD